STEIQHRAVERNLHAKLDADKRKAANISKESTPFAIDSLDDDEDDEEESSIVVEDSDEDEIRKFYSQTI
ncbi:hypothetical protein RYX36_022651, partial [Vicia faba]